MPCNCDYMDPTQKEQDSKEVAKLLCYVRKALGQPQRKVEKDAARDVYGNADMLNEFTVRLCDLCTGMNSTKANRIIYNGHVATARRLADWWDRHKLADEERKAAEKKQKRDEATKKRALKKLTPAEKRALGLD